MQLLIFGFTQVIIQSNKNSKWSSTKKKMNWFGRILNSHCVHVTEDVKRPQRNSSTSRRKSCRRTHPTEEATVSGARREHLLESTYATCRSSSFACLDGFCSSSAMGS